MLSCVARSGSHHVQPVLMRSRGRFMARLTRRRLLLLAHHTPPQRVHQIDDLTPARGLLFERQRKMFQLGLHQFAQGGFVIVRELFGIEFAGLPLNQFLGERKLLIIDPGLLHLGEIIRRVAQLRRIAQSISHHAR